MTALQEATPRRLQARVTGLLESLGAAMPGVGYLLGGILASLGTPRTAYAVAGVGVLVLVLAALPGRARLAAGTARPSGRPRAEERHPPDPLTAAPSFEHDAR
jgi:MFS family permease